MKYYAVVKGNKPGIYTEWPECEKQVKGFKGALYRSFISKQEAEDYIKQHLEQEEKVASVVPGQGWEIYVDGSYSPEVSNYSGGAVVLKDGKIVTEISILGEDKNFVEDRNIAGEALGMITALNYVLAHQANAVVAYYDYQGLGAWADGSWEPDSPVALDYVAKLHDIQKELDITFVKVEAHTGVLYNELADKLAKEALGILA